MDRLVEAMETAGEIMLGHLDGCLIRGSVDADDVVQLRENFDAFHAAMRAALRELVLRN